MSVDPPSEIIEKIKELNNECDVLYANEDYLGTIELLKRAWQLLPAPREHYSDSFHIAYDIAFTALKAGRLDVAKEWSNRLFKCAPHRAEVGERDFVAGQVAFACEDWELARKHFALAFKKSEGRCFRGQDSKYLAFYRERYEPPNSGLHPEKEQDSPDVHFDGDDGDVEGDELEEKLYKRVRTLAARGDAKFENEKYNEAIVQYRKALELLPEPQNRWEAASWLFTALGDVYHAQRLYSAAKEEFYNAANSPGGMQSAYIQMRLGQCQFECGELERAQDSLLRAYMADGVKVFEGEPEEYFDLIRPLVDGT